MARKITAFLVALLVVLFAVSAMAAMTGNKTPTERLGMALYNDSNLSLYANQACKTCHHPMAGFADPVNRLNPVLFPVSRGSDHTKFGGRNAPTAAYAGFSPKLYWDAIDGLFLGGLFWDGRASGLATTVTGGLGAGPTGDPLADQAKGPFLNPVEMALPNEAAVVSLVQSSAYASLFKFVFGPNAFANVGTAYNNIAKAIAAFERCSQVNKFSSRFDKFVKEQGGDVSTFGVVVDAAGFRKYVGPPPGFTSQFFSYNEADGLALFNADSYTQLNLAAAGANGGMCYLCHLTENHVTGPNSVLPPGVAYPPMLTDFSYDNLGMGVNPRIAQLAGPQGTDFGLGDISRVPELMSLNPGMATDPAGYAVEEIGKFKVPTLRNCARTAPYGHNGLFPTLYSIVHFYNTRDNPWPGETFPAPEVAATVNATELGNLGLTLTQEKKIVAFLHTLNDQ